MCIRDSIGAGYAARLHGEAYRRVSGCDIRLKTIVDLDREKAEELQKTYGYEECLTDYHLMLEDPKIDVVDICTPPNPVSYTHLDVYKRQHHTFGG